MDKDPGVDIDLNKPVNKSKALKIDDSGKLTKKQVEEKNRQLYSKLYKEIDDYAIKRMSQFKPLMILIIW